MSESSTAGPGFELSPLAAIIIIIIIIILFLNLKCILLLTVVQYLYMYCTGLDCHSLIRHDSLALLSHHVIMAGLDHG